jgi:hypothetical protein
VSITGLSTTATGTVLTLTDSASTSTVNLIIDNQKEIRFRETTANGTNYVALKAPASVSADLTFTLPATDGTSGQALTTDGSGALSFSTIQSPSGFRNIVINGDMKIAQRSTSVSSITTSGYYTIDRMNTVMSSLGTWTISQSTDTPTGEGFANSLKLDCTTADASPSASDFLILNQKFEGQNLQYLKKGTSNAVSLTASFWIKSTKTGTFIVELFDADNTRSISKSYTVNTTNTWEKKTVTFAGDTTGALGNDNGNSLSLEFWLGAGTDFTSGTLATTWGSTTTANRAVGQVNIADSTSNDWYITGVQLEAGTSATDFEFLPIDVSLGRCQRYFQKIDASSGNSVISVFQCSGSDTAIGSIPNLIEMRSTATFSTTGTFNIFTATTGSNAGGTLALFSSTKTQQGVTFARTGASTLTAGDAGGLYSASGSSSILLSAEL